MIKNTHKRFNPNKKDLFISINFTKKTEKYKEHFEDDGYIRNATKLDVHCVKENELKDRVINFNSGPSPLNYFQGFYQHGILVYIDDYKYPPTRTYHIKKDWISLIRFPGEVEKIVINPKEICKNYGKLFEKEKKKENKKTDIISSDDKNYFDEIDVKIFKCTIAHEICHGLGVRHHGDYRETPGYTPFDGPFCIMRYIPYSEDWKSYGYKSLEEYLNQPIPDILCNSTEGCAPGRGDCIHKYQVRDGIYKKKEIPSPSKKESTVKNNPFEKSYLK